MRGLPTIGLLAAWLLGCASKSPPADDPATAAAPVAAVAEPSPEAVPAVPAPQPPQLLVGWKTVPAEPLQQAVRLNKRALELHGRGEYARSLAGFEEALTISPDAVWPRYNAACALSRLGRVDEAAPRLRALLLEDLPTFRKRFLQDDDLEALRGSSAGKDLLEELDRISAAYGKALRHGTAAFTYETRPGWTGEDIRDARTPYKNLRIGIYDHRTGRFVPMVPKVKRAFSGLISRDRKRAIVAFGDLHVGDVYVVQPRRAGAHLYSLEGFGDLLLSARGLSPDDDVYHGFELWLGPGDSLYGTHIGISYSEQTDYFRFTTKGRRKIGWTHQDTEQTDPPKEVPMSAPSLSVVELAEVIDPTKSAVKVKDYALTVEGVEGTVPLSKDYQWVQLVPSPDPKIVVTVRRALYFSSEGADEDPPAAVDEHVVDLVDMHKLESTRLSDGPGYVHIAWAPDGTLFVDAQKGVHRYAPGSAEPHDDVLPGVRFGTPPFPEDGGV